MQPSALTTPKWPPLRHVGRFLSITVLTAVALLLVLLHLAPRWRDDAVVHTALEVGAILCAFGASISILARRQEALSRELAALNDLLEAERNQLRTVIDHLPLGILIAHAPAGEAGVINRKGIELLGLSIVHSTGKIDYSHTYNLYRPDGTPYPPKELPFHHTLATGEPAQAEDVILRRPDRREILLWVQAVPLRDKAGQVVGAVSVYQDVTLLKEAEKARAAVRAQLQFLSTMSHELRTPLHSILALSQLLIQEDNHPLLPDQVECLRVLHRSGEHLLRLIDDLMDLTKLEAGKMELRLSTFSFADTLDWVLGSLRTSATQKGLSITCDLPPHLPPLHSDEKKVSQILFNLLHNAIKFTERGGVHISARVEAGASGEERLEVAIKDTGIGIAPHQIPLIFERFRQLDEGLARKYGGTGLGLAICQSLVELIGGALWCESAVGVGSTFRFTAPICCPSQERLSTNLSQSKGEAHHG